MEKLIEAYLRSIEHYAMEEGIVRIDPCIKDDEQHWDIEYKNMCCSSGVDYHRVSVSELLAFMYGRLT